MQAKNPKTAGDRKGRSELLKHELRQLAFGKRHCLAVALAFTGGAGGISFQFMELNGLAWEEAAAGAVSAPLDGLFIRSRIKDSALSIG